MMATRLPFEPTSAGRIYAALDLHGDDELQRTSLSEFLNKMNA